MVGVLLNAAVRLSFVCRSRRGPKFDTIYFEKNFKKLPPSSSLPPELATLL